MMGKPKSDKHDVWATEIRVKKKLPKKILSLIEKYEKLEVSES